ncbi:MAG: adenosylcobinamide-phosphate synthase CbiB, partial [Chloroflexota bacterium]|nr:adenosylcobinamide-phosphate synthase CbiB [Chloroflexota bacterium]
MPSSWSDAFVLNALVLLLAVALDLLLPEPPAIVHPVVWMGKAISAFERVAPAGPVAGLFFGCAVVIVIVGISGGIAWLAMTALGAVGPVAYVIGGVVMLRISFTVRGLVSAAGRTRRALEGGHLDEAKESLQSLVSRDAEDLSASLVAAAAIESVAENTTDSFIAPWLAFAVFGVPGAVAFRAINTLDSMLGTRGRYEYFGKTAARLDDVVNMIPARLSALLLLISGGFGRLPLARGWRTMLRDRHLTASSNAGWTMGAMAG